MTFLSSAGTQTCEGAAGGGGRGDKEASTGLETSRSKDGEVPLNHDDQQEAARMLTQRELRSLWLQEFHKKMILKQVTCLVIRFPNPLATDMHGSLGTRSHVW